MYITTNGSKYSGPNNFDWDKYFENKNNAGGVAFTNSDGVIKATRKHLKENEGLFGFVFHKVMRDLFQHVRLSPNPAVLELGAASGFLTRWLIQKFGGYGTLVDKSKEAFQAFLKANKGEEKSFSYIKQDIFALNLDQKVFDIICSFGVVEHFFDKSEIMECHKSHLGKDGYVLIMIPLDTPLTRAFYEINFELNQGYRELLTENELKRIATLAELKIVSSAKSEGYVYDFFGILCTKQG